MQEEDNVAILISQQGNVQLTGADISHGAVMDAREALLLFLRSQVIQPVMQPQQEGPPNGEEAED